VCAEGAVHRLPGQKVRSGKGGKVLPSHKAFLNGAGGTYRNKVGGSIWPVSIFYTTIQVGTPAKEFPVAIDSGSFTLNIPSTTCDGCVTKAPNNAYDPKASSSSEEARCDFGKKCALGECVLGRCEYSNTYETCNPVNPTQPCTISGRVYQDQVAISSSPAVDVDIGLIDKQTPGFYQFETVDGVMGMAGPPGAASVISQLHSAGDLDEDLWALCILPGGTTSNGTITLGGVPSDLYHGQIKYTPNPGATTGSPFYEMTVNSMSLGSTKLSNVESTVIIDTGTNDLLLNTRAFDSMHSILKAGCGVHNYTGICNVPAGSSLFDGKCFDMTAAEIAAFPSITLSVPGIDLVMDAEDYLRKDFGLVHPTGKTCLAVGDTGNEGLFIVGDTLLINYLTVFDRGNSRIGFAPVDAAACLSS